MEREPTQNSAAKSAIAQRAGAASSEDKRAQVGKENTNKGVRGSAGGNLLWGPVANFYKFMNPNRKASSSEFQYNVSNIITKCV